MRADTAAHYKMTKHPAQKFAGASDVLCIIYSVVCSGVDSK